MASASSGTLRRTQAAWTCRWRGGHLVQVAHGHCELCVAEIGLQETQHAPQKALESRPPLVACLVKHGWHEAPVRKRAFLVCVRDHGSTPKRSSGIVLVKPQHQAFDTARGDDGTARSPAVQQPASNRPPPHLQITTSDDDRHGSQDRPDCTCG